MILMRANQLCRPLEGVGPEISTFWTQMDLASLFAISGRKKVSISGLTPSNGPRTQEAKLYIHKKRLNFDHFPIVTLHFSEDF